MHLRTSLRCLLAAGLALFLACLIPPARASSVDAEQRIYDFLRTEMQLNTAAACGVLANIEAESNFSTTALGDNGTSFGICQWHNGRFDRLKQFCRTYDLDYTSLNGQLEYLRYELQTGYSNVLTTLRRLPNSEDGAYQAGYLWCYYFEIPASREESSARRGRNAQYYYWPVYSARELLQPSGTDPLFSFPDPWQSSSFYWETQPEETQPLETQPDQEAPVEAPPTQPQPVSPSGQSGSRFSLRFHYVPHHRPVQTSLIGLPLSILFQLIAPKPQNPMLPLPEAQPLPIA